MGTMADERNSSSSPAPSQRAARAEARERATAAARKKDWAAHATVWDAVSGPSGSRTAIVNTAGSGKRSALVENDDDRRSERSGVSSRSVMPRVANVIAPLVAENGNSRVIGERALRSRSVHSGVSSARPSKPNSGRSASVAPSLNNLNDLSEINGMGSVGERVRSRGLSEHGIPPRA